jgi:DNA-binding response OmpR family regulator
MAKTILIVDDEPEILDAIQLTLEVADLRVVRAGNAAEALDVLQTESVNLILTDVAMPQMNGYQLFAAVNQHPAWRYIPFIFLSGRNLDSDIQYGKELGVDDYLTKPVNSAELLASVRGKLKRAERWLGQQPPASPLLDMPAEDNAICLGNLRINLPQHRVWVDEQPVQLTQAELKLLACLTERPGWVLPHEQIVQATHDLQTDTEDASRLLRPLVASLRRKLGYPGGDTGPIQNVRGVGYQFILPTS